MMVWEVMVMTSDDLLAIADLDDSDRTTAMKALFQELANLAPEAQYETLRQLIAVMAEKASDAQYLRLCATNLMLAAQMPDDQLRPFLGLRMKASASLPEAYAKRDQSMVQQAINEAALGIREKIVRNFAL
jgi:ABC-type phosphonate transport system ATPase subunit